MKAPKEGREQKKLIQNYTQKLNEAVFTVFNKKDEQMKQTFDDFMHFFTNADLSKNFVSSVFDSYVRVFKLFDSLDTKFFNLISSKFIFSSFDLHYIK